MKASPMDSLFQLGVTRYALPDSSSSSSGGASNSGSGSNSNNSSNGCSPAGGGGGKATTTLFNGNGSIVGIGEGLIKDGGGNCADEGDAAAATNGAVGKKGNCDADGEDDDYHPTATPGGGVVYSEGTQKTDLLY
ncbi:keratin, type I cytoskeletal 9-like [Drosophila obscura]|uniref:keratin, type I cytoskeletal 9-like n=1 Tax=Drosophila obscura TaxID=7282 RepID=UPI001BB27700|nr:keratin, type I cytoskeletal 9-like [Drosophila obscura]